MKIIYAIPGTDKNARKGGSSRKARVAFDG